MLEFLYGIILLFNCSAHLTAEQEKSVNPSSTADQSNASDSTNNNSTNNNSLKPLTKAIIGASVGGAIGVGMGITAFIGNDEKKEKKEKKEAKQKRLIESADPKSVSKIQDLNRAALKSISAPTREIAQDHLDNLKKIEVTQDSHQRIKEAHIARAENYIKDHYKE